MAVERGCDEYYVQTDKLNYIHYYYYYYYYYYFNFYGFIHLSNGLNSYNFTPSSNVSHWVIVFYDTSNGLWN